MTNEEFYGASYGRLQVVEQAAGAMIFDSIHDIDGSDANLVKYISHRIKDADSTIEKLKRHGLPCTAENALTTLTDIVGYRVVVRFLSDLYTIKARIESSEFLKVILVKDYVTNPKPNGYRAIHLIVNVDVGGMSTPVEIQLRTMAMDCWASLEHQVNYKQNIINKTEIAALMKECADKMLVVDRDMDDAKSRMVFAGKDLS